MPRAESVIPPSFIDIVHASSVFVLTPARLEVARTASQVGAKTWHVFRIVETLSTPARSGATYPCRQPETSVVVSRGEIALPFTDDADMDSPFPRGWDRFPIVPGRRYLGFVIDCGSGVGELQFGPMNFVELSPTGGIIPGELSAPGASAFDSLDKVRHLIADLARADADKPPSALLVGRTVDAATGRPVGDALVTLSGVIERAVLSTGEGWFFFRDLPTFSYTLTSSKQGWSVDAASVAAGQVRLSPGERRGDILLRLHRPPTVEGTVRDENGRPLIGAGVTAYRLAESQNERRAILGNRQARTDDRGHFVIDAGPGEYLIAASMYPLTQVERNEQATLFYPPTFYPAGSSPGAASIVTVRPDESIKGLDILVRPMIARRITGTVRYAGRPAPGVTLGLDRDDRGFESDLSSGGFAGQVTRPTADGSFAFEHLAPGNYIVRAVRSSASERWIKRAVTITDRDVEGVTIDLSDDYRSEASRAAPVAGPAVPRGDARIEGIVSDAEKRPLNRTLVTLTDVVTQTSRKRETDLEGRFAFPDVAAGRYAVTIARDGYVVDETAPPPERLDVSRRQTARVDLAMRRGGVVTGVAVDESGAPVSGISVRLRRVEVRDALSSVNRNGGSSPAGAMVGQTDEQGRYRIFGVPSGDYLIVAQWPTRGYAPELATDDVEKARTEVRTPRSLVQRGQAGSVSSAEVTPASVARVLTRARQLVPVFYPDAVNPANARPVHVSIENETAGCDIQMVITRAVAVSGTVQTESGPFHGYVPVRFEALDGYGSSSGDSFTGTFRNDGVAPGRHALIAEWHPQSRDPAAHRWARVEIEVGSRDLEGVDLVLGPTAWLRTRVLAGDGAGLPSEPIGVRLDPMTPARKGDAARASTDGAATLVGLAPGRYRFAVFALAKPQSVWDLRSVSLNGVELRDGILDVERAGSLGDVVIRLGTR